MSCGVSHRGGLDPALIWLWRKLVATAPIIPLALETPYVMVAVLKKKKNNSQNGLLILLLGLISSEIKFIPWSG